MTSSRPVRSLTVSRRVAQQQHAAHLIRHATTKPHITVTHSDNPLEFFISFYQQKYHIQLLLFVLIYLI